MKRNDCIVSIEITFKIELYDGDTKPDCGIPMVGVSMIKDEEVFNV